MNTPAQPAKRPPAFGEIDLGDEAASPGTLELDTGAGPKQEYELDELVDLPTKKKAPGSGGAPPRAGRVPITYKGESPEPPPGGAEAGRPAQAGAPAEPSTPRPPRPRKAPPRPEEPPEPRRSYAREIKIALIAILALGLLGGGTYGFLKWREGVRLAEEAQLRALDQGSLDSLKNDSLNKGKLGN